MKILIKAQRVYLTEIEVEADSIQEARTNFMRGDYDDIIHVQELEQCNVLDVDAEFDTLNN